MCDHLTRNHSKDTDRTPVSRQKVPFSRPGKIDHDLLPVEYKLDRFFVNVTNRPASWNTHTAGCLWVGVRCDSQSIVTHLQCGFQHLVGTLQWTFLPSSLQSLALTGNRFSGAATTSELPPNLSRISLGHNRFSNGIDLSHFSSLLKIFELNHNLFCGRIDLSSLPSSLTELSIRSNRFCGSISLRSFERRIALSRS